MYKIYFINILKFKKREILDIKTTLTLLETNELHKMENFLQTHKHSVMALASKLVTWRCSVLKFIGFKM